MNNIIQDIIWGITKNTVIKYWAKSKGCLTKAIFFITRFTGWQMHAICYVWRRARASISLAINLRKGMCISIKEKYVYNTCKLSRFTDAFDGCKASRYCSKISKKDLGVEFNRAIRVWKEWKSLRSSNFCALVDCFIIRRQFCRNSFYVFLRGNRDVAFYTVQFPRVFRKSW